MCHNTCASAGIIISHILSITGFELWQCSTEYLSLRYAVCQIAMWQDFLFTPHASRSFAAKITFLLTANLDKSNFLNLGLSLPEANLSPNRPRRRRCLLANYEGNEGQLTCYVGLHKRTAGAGRAERNPRGRWGTRGQWRGDSGLPHRKSKPTSREGSSAPLRPGDTQLASRTPPVTPRKADKTKAGLMPREHYPQCLLLVLKRQRVSLF